MRPLPFLLLLCELALPSLAGAQADGERLRNAKTLFFDRRYGEARQAWREILSRSRGGEADAAAYWIARCSENLGEPEVAFKDYEAFLARRPVDRTLVEEARTSRVGLAARLYKAGRTQYLSTLNEALSEPSKTVRYYAALQIAGLGPGVGEKAIPVLRQIVEQEKDDDLVDRAKLGLLRLDPQSLSRLSRPTPSSRGRWLKVRILERGHQEPTVSINLPLALAKALFNSLPEEAKRELTKKGYDADNFFERLDRLGNGAAGTSIIDIQGDEGERIQIWIE
jgi:tetratricopeptide (TPR) repeat protein